MSPLRVERFNNDSNSWTRVGDLAAGDPPGTFSSNLEDGRRDIYRFLCEPGGKYSLVQRLGAGFDMDIGRLRVTDARSVVEAETLATLRSGDTPYELTIKTDRSPQGRKVRFTHIET